jgi:acyl dehydratase
MAAPIVLGALTAAIAEGLASQVVTPDLGLPIGWERITLVAPVYVHDSIHVEANVLGGDSSNPEAPTRVLVRAFTGDNRLVAELVTLYAASMGSSG